MIAIIAILNYALFFILAFYMVKKYLNADFHDLGSPYTEERGLSGRNYHRYLKTYFDVFHTMNIRSMSSISTDVYYHALESSVRFLNKLGLRKEIGLKTSAEEFGTAASFTMGNVNWISQCISGSYKERLIDAASGQILDKKSCPKAVFEFALNKNPFREKEEEKFCVGCGSPLGVNGELFICSSCGATYTSDSYDWVISNASYRVQTGKSPFQIIIYFLTALMAAVPIMSIFALKYEKLVLPSIIGIVIFFLINIGLFTFAAWYYHASEKIRKRDPLYNIFRLSSRIEYLLQLIINSRLDNRPAMKQFMDTAAYADWMVEEQNASGLHVVDYKIRNKVILLKNYRITDGRQHLDVVMPLKLSVFNLNTRKLSKVNKTLHMTIYRNENTVCQNRFTSELFICSGCGMSVNLTAHGKCKFCGTEYDIAMYDWKIEKLDKSLYL